MGALPGARGVLNAAGTIGHDALPVVLFDFDGTVIDSGSIIIASMRHATKTVLGRDIPDEELGRAVGGSGLIEQMRVIAPTGSTSSSPATASTTSRCTPSSPSARG